MTLLGVQITPKVQGVVVVLALAAAGILAYRAWPTQTLLDENVNFVCVKTGNAYSIDRDDVTSVPLKNPDTGEATLVPCVRRDGKLFMDAHYRSALDGLTEVNKYVDKDTLAVRNTP